MKTNALNREASRANSIFLAAITTLMLGPAAFAGQPQAISAPIFYTSDGSQAVQPAQPSQPTQSGQSNYTFSNSLQAVAARPVYLEAPASVVTPAPAVVTSQPLVVVPATAAVLPPVQSTPAPRAMSAHSSPAPVPALIVATPPPQPVQAPVIIAAVPAPAPVVLVTAPVQQPVPRLVSSVELSPAPEVVTITPADPSSNDTLAQETGQDKTLYSFRADGIPLKTALAMFARANNLNIVPDNDVAGFVTLDVHNLSLNQMMRALLEAGDCSWEEDDGLIRIHNSETRTFTVDYLRLSRNGVGESSATLNSASAGGSGTGGSSTSSSTGGSTGGSSVELTANNATDFWTELTAELGHMLTEQGQKSMAINRTAGIVEITDRPSVLHKVEHYLTATQNSIHRQVDIDAEIYDVTLNNQFQFGIDWTHVAEAYGGSLGFGAATLPVANGASQLGDSALASISRLPIIGTPLSTTAGGNLTSLVFSNFNTAAAINALKSQGDVEVISKPRIRTLNNQTALIKVGEDLSFFNTTTTYEPGTSSGTTIPVQQITVSSITVGTILSLTPQISGNNWISMDISPVLTSLKDIQTFGSTSGGSGSSGGSSGATAPDLDTKQASTLVRIHDGTTVIIGGLIQTETDKNDTSVPVLGDIPLLGKLFTGTYRNKVKKELVIFVTPHIIQDGMEASVVPPPAMFDQDDKLTHRKSE